MDPVGDTIRKGFEQYDPGFQFFKGLNPGSGNSNQNTDVNPETGFIRGSLPDMAKMREIDAGRAKKKEEDDARAKELAPLQKALRDEVGFLGQKYAYGSKIGGRGLF